MAKRIFLFLLGGFTLLMGSFFTWIMAQSYLKAKETRSWTKVPAMILEAEIEERKIGEYVPTDYAARVEFGYEINGQRLTSNLLTPRGQKWAKEKKKAEVQLEGITAGEWTECWVNPSSPEIAILKHDTKAAGYSIWFPLLFVVGGAGVMVGAFRKRTPTT